MSKEISLVSATVIMILKIRIKNFLSFKSDKQSNQ